MLDQKELWSKLKENEQIVTKLKEIEENSKDSNEILEVKHQILNLANLHDDISLSYQRKMKQRKNEELFKTNDK